MDAGGKGVVGRGEMGEARFRHGVGLTRKKVGKDVRGIAPFDGLGHAGRHLCSNAMV